MIFPDSAISLLQRPDIDARDDVPCRHLCHGTSGAKATSRGKGQTTDRLQSKLRSVAGMHS